MSALKFDFKTEDYVESGLVTREEIDAVTKWTPSVGLPEMPDEMAVAFLRACRRHVDNTKRAIVKFFMCEKNNPEIFDDRDVDMESLQLASNTMHHACMPVRTDDDCSVHVFKLNDTRYHKFHLDSIMKLCFMLVYIALNRGPPRGLKIVLDAKGTGLMHLTRLKIKTIRAMMEYFQEAMPLNMLEIHILNTAFFVDKTLFLVRPFMNEKVSKSLHVHLSSINMEEFFEKYIPAKCMPKDYGGLLPSMEELNKSTINEYRKLKGFFKNLEDLRKNLECDFENIEQ